MRAMRTAASNPSFYQINQPVIEADIQFAPWIGLHEFRPDRAQVQNAEADRCVDSQHPDGLGRCRRYGFFRRIHHGQYIFCLMVELPSFIRQRKSARGAMQQSGTQSFFEPADIV
ncbi:hypothetical protein ALP50_200049 [Pseudomonas syringae pv. spinaceae]|nr:hypothetical protein ALP50_200049 [Pseudomonas syringae pv. spinaceae]